MNKTRCNGLYTVSRVVTLQEFGRWQAIGVFIIIFIMYFLSFLVKNPANFYA